jgi:transposase
VFDVGLDLGKRTSHVCLRRADGSLLEKKVSTTREALTAFFGPLGPCRILLESSTSSEWVARHLESMGNEVIVADPNFGPMYAQRTRKVKTDKRDARGLRDALEVGAYKPAHRASDEQRRLRREIDVRATLVETRTKYIIQTRAFLELEGFRPPRCESETFPKRVREMELPEALLESLLPLVEMLESLNVSIAGLDKKMLRAAKASPVASRLMTVPGVGAITSLAFVGALGDVQRFNTAREVRGYLGLVPREYSSSEKRIKGSITKVGDPRLRALLVQASWSFLKSHDERARDLQEWTMQIAARRGAQRAIVALARKLAGILFAIWRDDVEFAPRSHLTVKRSKVLAAA